MPFTIAPTEKPEVAKRLAALGRKAEKLGLDWTPSVEYTERIVPAAPEIGRPETVVLDAEFNFESLRLPGGWEFVATIEHGPEGNLVYSFEGAPEVPASYRTDGPSCDHCGHERDRLNTIVVRDEDGAFKRVGTTCSRSYLGIPASKLVPLMSDLEGFRDDDEFFGGSRESADPSLNDILYRAVALCRYEGFKPAAFGADSTRSAVTTWLYPSNSEKETLKEFWNAASAKVEPGDVDAVKAWVAAADGSSDYIANLKAAFGFAGVSPRRLGLVVSAAGVWLREVEKIKVEKAEAKVPSEFIGSVKDRIKFEGGELVYTSYSSGYGYYDPDDVFAFIRFGTDVVSIKTSTGSAVGSLIEDIDKGDADDDTVLSFKATIKEHSTDSKGRKVTKVTRAALLK